MNRMNTVSGVALLLSALAAGAGPGAGQQPEVPEARRVRELPRQHLSGPRFGFTAFTGDVADRRDAADLEPLMTQFGWQFETQIVSMDGGQQVLMEWIVLVGGVEQSEMNLSVAWLAGYRLDNGVELGGGPNLSYNKDSEDTTTSMQVAGGATLPFGDLFVPVNLAVGIAEGGPRFTALMGWIIG